MASGAVIICSRYIGSGDKEKSNQSAEQVVLTALSYPFLALFSAGAAFYRASGNSKFPTKVSIISNLINVTGNALFLYAFGWEAAGVALATLLSRMFSTIVIFYCLRKPGQTIVVRDYLKLRPDIPLILGTVAISAQVMTDILELVNGIFSNSVGIWLAIRFSGGR